MNVLVIAPHADDEVLGCGGTIAKFVSQGHDVFVAVVTKGYKPLFVPERVENTILECKKADSILGVKETIFLDFPAVMLETVPRNELNNAFHELIQRICPNIVFLPHRGDMQLDHKMTVDAAMVALRPKYKHIVEKIYSYETLSETGWDVPSVDNSFIPNCYVDISDFLEKKVYAMSEYASQISDYPNARSIEALKALAMYRGATVNFNAAEAFSLIREVFI